MKKVQTVVIGVAIIVRKDMRDFFVYSLAAGNNLENLEKSVKLDIKEEIDDVIKNDKGIPRIKEIKPLNFRTDKCQSLHMSYINKKACFGIGNDVNLIGASIAAGDEIKKKEKINHVPRADMEVIIKDGRVFHHYSLNEYLVED